jgi:hypothetical protein
LAAEKRAGVGIVLQKRLASNNDQPTRPVEFFRPIDTAGVARDFKIEVIARDRGRHNLPGTHDNNLDELEQKITGKIEGEWAWQGDKLLNSLRDCAAQLVNCSIPREVIRLQIQAEHVLAWLRVATSKALRDLTPLQQKYLDARDELQEFRNRNCLSRPPREPAHYWRTFIFLFILVAVESLLSELLFAKGNEVGLLDGSWTAVGVSLTSVALSFLLGLGPSRWRNHRDRFISTSGVLITLAGIGSIVALHLFAAHLHVSNSLVGKKETFAIVLETIKETPWGLPNTTSFCLLGMGLIFALGAIWKGYCFDDSYPLYGAAYRREKSARDKYAKAYFALLEELSRVKEDAVVDLNDGILRLPKFRQMAVDVRATRAAMLNSFRAYESSVETATNQLLRLYRDINHAQRTTAPPASFDEKWQLPLSFLLSPELKTLLTDPEMGDVATSVVGLERLSEAIITRYGLLKERYPHPLEIG